MLLLHKALVFASDRLMGTKDIIIEVEVLSLIFSLAVDFSLETLMCAWDPMKLDPLYKKSIEKIKCRCIYGKLENGLCIYIELLNLMW